MSTTTLQSYQEQLIREIRRHENKAKQYQALAGMARTELISVNKKIMLAKKSTLKQGMTDWHTFCNYMQQ